MPSLKSLVEIVANLATAISNSPRQQLLDYFAHMSSKNICLLFNVLETDGRNRILRKLRSREAAKLIEKLITRDHSLVAALLEGIDETTRLNIVAFFPSETRQLAKDILQAWQRLGEIEFTINGEFVPDLYVMTGTIPDKFPPWMRNCSVCEREGDGDDNGEYGEFDSIRHGICRRHSFHERCSRGSSGGCAVRDCFAYDI
jgi:hypothetical protein